MTETSPRLRARIAGLLYLGTMVTGIFDLVARSGLIVRGDAAATAAHIMGAEPLYRTAVAAEFLGGAFYVGVTAMLYGLLRPVSRSGSLAAAFFGLAGCATGAAGMTWLLGPPMLLSGAPYLAVFRPDQLQALALTALRFHTQAYNLCMIFFGIYCALLGVLVFRSAFFPRALGVLLVLAGAGWLTDSLSYLLWPAFSSQIQPYIMAPGFIGEAALCVWLLVVGVDGPKWTRASAVSGLEGAAA